MIKSRFIRTYFFSLLLICSIILGGIFGYVDGEYAQKIKPLGELFLHLVFTTIVPLVFFSIASACSKMNSWKKYGAIFSAMMGSFFITGLIAATITLIIVKLFPLGQNILFNVRPTELIPSFNVLNKLVDLLSVPNFIQVFSHEHMLALIVFAMLVGIASARADEKNQMFSVFLQSGEAIFMRVFNVIMYYAPIGFFAYFAALVDEMGSKILINYAHVTLVYYGIAIVFFVVIYSGYAYLAGKKVTVKTFWRNILLPASTALATCSSAATIPANLAATKAMLLPSEICETVIPLGTIIHKEGSIIGGMIKIAFLFGMYHIDFSGTSTLLTAVGVSMLVGTVMGAIPSGGMLGELLILSVYGFPSSALVSIAAISIIIDPMATLLNATGNTINCVLIAKLYTKIRSTWS